MPASRSGGARPTPRHSRLDGWLFERFHVIQHVVVRNSTMEPAGSAHPMWSLHGDVDVDGFTTTNSEFHLNGVQARLNRLKIFELEISQRSHVIAKGLDLVFLSTHSSDDDHLR